MSVFILRVEICPVTLAAYLKSQRVLPNGNKWKYPELGLEPPAPPIITTTLLISHFTFNTLAGDQNHIFGEQKYKKKQIFAYFNLVSQNQPLSVW